MDASKKGISISLNIELPTPQKSEDASPPWRQDKPSVEQQVREAIEECESGRASRAEWLMLGRLRTTLLEKQRSASPEKRERINNILDMINPLLSKYGFHGVSPKEK